MVNRILKKIIAIICIMVLIIPMTSEVLAKIVLSEEGKKQKFGITAFHNSKYLSNENLTKNFGYKVNERITYRVYSGDNKESNDAFENTILCLDQSGDFPGEKSANQEQEYESKGSAEVALKNIETKQYGTKQKLSDEDIKKIMWLMRNAVLPEDSSEVKELKLSKIFESSIAKTQTTQNPLTLSYIKEILTEDDLVFALQATIWSITNKQKNPTYYGAIQSDSPKYNLLAGNDVMTEDGKQGEFINIIIDYYKANCTSEKDIIITDLDKYTTPVITKPNEKLIFTNKEELVGEGEKLGIEDNGWIFVGPFKIEGKEENKDIIDYSIDLVLKNGNKIIPQTGEDKVKFYIAAVKEPTGTTKEPNSATPRFGLTKAEIEKNGNQFYIVLKKGTSVDNIDIKINSAKNISETKATVWEHADKNMQPLISIEREESETENVETNYEFETKYEREFDIALRKSISTILREKENGWEPIYNSDKKGYISREPLKGEAENNTFNQFTYKHPKNEMSVEVGDIIRYRIRVYNEGEYIVRITQIADYLPTTGLKFLEEGTESGVIDGIERHITEYQTNNYTLKETNGNDKTTIMINKLRDQDAICSATLESGQYIEVELEFQVTEEAKGRIITNIAEVTGFTGQESKEDLGNGIGNFHQVVDVDSAPNNVVLPTTDEDWENYKGNVANKSDLSQTDYYYKGQEDDDDFEKIIVPDEKYIDLALRKSITAHNGKEVQRQRDPDTTPLQDGEETSNFLDIKEPPVSVQIGDKIVYTIRVFNEGNQDGYATKITDYIPEGLGFLPNYKENLQYGWESKNTTKQLLSEIPNATSNFDSTEFDNSQTSYENQTVICGKATVETDILKDTKLNKFNKTTGKLQIIEIPITCVVLAPTEKEEKIERRNIAAITEYADENKNTIPEDRDSYPDNDLSDFEENDHEDDEDYEKLIVNNPQKKFDLSLRKFITKIGDKEITDRVPKVDTTGLDDGTSTTAKYQHPKEEDIKVVVTGQVVEYTIRIYNEGDFSGYASEIKDDIPEGLEFLPEHQTNKDNMWKMYDKDGNETEDVKSAVSIRTNAKSKENGTEKSGGDTSNPYYKSNTNIINAYDPDKMKDGPDYVDVKVAFRVVKDTVTDGNTVIINTAEITKETDEGGKEVEDRDSIPNNDKPNEDDIDKEYIQLKYFDLSLLKYVSKVIVTEDGVTKETETGYDGTENPEPVVKVELNKNKLAQTQVKYVYTIKITNEGQIEGYAKEITDRIPEGLVFFAEDNKATGWVEKEAGIITTDYLKDTLLKPGESATVQVVLRWINSETNLGQKVNVAEISVDENEYGIPDIDSTPGNNIDGEDDQDEAIVVLSINTGATPLHITLITIVTTMLATGIYLIYKYVIKR